MNMRKKLRKTAMGIVLATEYACIAFEQPGQLQPKEKCRVSICPPAETDHRGIRTFKRNVFSWSVEREFHARVWSEEACVEAGIWTSLVVDEEGILGLGERDCSLLLFVSVRIPNHLCRAALDDTVGWAHGIGVAIRGAESGDGQTSGGLYNVGKVPSKGNWVVCCDFIVGGGCCLWWLSK
jgi:hypothetical protein